MISIPDSHVRMTSSLMVFLATISSPRRRDHVYVLVSFSTWVKEPVLIWCPSCFVQRPLFASFCTFCCASLWFLWLFILLSIFFSFSYKFSCFCILFSCSPFFMLLEVILFSIPCYWLLYLWKDFSYKKLIPHSQGEDVTYQLVYDIIVH